MHMPREFKFISPLVYINRAKSRLTRTAQTITV